MLWRYKITLFYLTIIFVDLRLLGEGKVFLKKSKLSYLNNHKTKFKNECFDGQNKKNYIFSLRDY